MKKIIELCIKICDKLIKYSEYFRLNTLTTVNTLSHSVMNVINSPFT